MRSHKCERILDIYIALSKGQVVNKSEYTNKHNVDCRTIQRNVDDIRAFVCDSFVMGEGIFLDVYYEHQAHGYRVA